MLGTPLNMFANLEAFAASAAAIATTLDPTFNTNTNVSYSTDHLTFMLASGAGSQTCRSTTSHLGSATGDWSFTVTGTNNPSTVIGFATSALSNTDYPGGGAVDSAGYWNAGGQILANPGGTVGSPSRTYDLGTGDYVTCRLKNGHLYFAWNGAWQFGADPVAETGGLNVSSWGALYAAANASNVTNLTFDFTHW